MMTFKARQTAATKSLRKLMTLKLINKPRMIWAMMMVWKMSINRAMITIRA